MWLIIIFLLDAFIFELNLIRNSYEIFYAIPIYVLCEFDCLYVVYWIVIIIIDILGFEFS